MSTKLLQPTEENAAVDFQQIFDSFPGNYIVFKSNAPHFTIVAVSDSLLNITGRKRENIVGKGVFDAFPENPDAITATGPKNLRLSLERVIKYKKADKLPVVRYDVVNGEGKFEDRYWNPSNHPVFNKAGEVSYIIHTTKDVTADIKSELEYHSLHEADKDFTLFMQAPVAVCIVRGPEYIVQLANEEMLRILGRSAGIIGNPMIETLTEAKSQGLIGLLDHVRKSGHPFKANAFRAELNIDGERIERYFNLIFKPYYLSATEKEANSIFCVAHDVTDQVVAAKKVEESEYRFRTLIEEATVATALFQGPELRIQYVNDLMIKYWGKDNSVIGKPLLEVLPEIMHQPFPGLLQKVYTTGEPYIGVREQADLFIDGRLQSFYFNFTYKALRNKEGEIYAIHHMAIDVTEEVLAMKQLEEEKERSRLAVESAELGPYEVNLLTNKVEASKRMAAIFGIDPSQDRKAYINAIHPDDVYIRDRAHQLSLETGLINYEARVIWKDSSIHWVKVNGKLFFNEEHQPVRILGIVQDITDQKLYAEQLQHQVSERTAELEAKNKELERSNANLEEFAYVASHDLKEPIRKIMYFSERLKQQLAERLKDDENFTIRRIENAVQRMGALVDDLLLYSHVSFRPHEKEKVDLDEKVKKVMEDLELDIEEKKAIIQSVKLPVINGYPRQLQQLFQNVLSNAIKYNKPEVPPVINISVATFNAKEAGFTSEADAGKKYYCIEITDNGIGFEQQDAEKIFQVFQRLHGNSEYRGTGIGLAIAKKVVENHDGRIIAKSAPGEGATFRIYLPTD